MRVLLLRHGATAGNEERRYVGKRTDEPLSQLGIDQCKRFGAWRGADKVYCSSLLRARQTAQLCFPRAQVVLVQGLEEFDFGAFEGRTADEMAHDAAYRAWVESNCKDACPGGESLEDFVTRTRRTITRMLFAARGNGEDRVAIVAHGGTIMAALDGFYSKHVGNCEGYVTTACFSGDSVVLKESKLIRYAKEMAPFAYHL